ncbi:Sb-PDE family phosphodiesterase [Fulvivirga sedimenti]|uniref:Polymerase/histidinol phosphatase N-terminal domain-containing protein n=1 Tax=Fulvivirga sedimenti TaxID=2879465 RepID=A0A9X1HRD3_9BACT|nr:Sb-PDE family phosphodiesterase [Fulvivirga sedimenti]MCA6075443.1 hypothetical protein [Fulvivirga sedimenti]MCA6076620.1 hypothetical protein [Fulvivirga sedimenti]MCA6077748.1 hypothetical protein [Fulvivirga sedimenti]
MKKIATIMLMAGLSVNLLAQENDSNFPDVPGYETLKVDLHMHTVFSDGSVWPDIRVYEAVREGLDLIAMTEHLEYQPHEDDIPHPDRNRSYEIASKIAAKENLIVVPGSEITRSMPPGHSNAIFIQDANKLLKDDVLEVFREANRQGAFTFWNHPMWAYHYKDGVAKLTDLHRTLISEGLLHGIEVVNEHMFSDEALQIALDNNLTILGTSDIHGLVDWEFDIPEGGHRPLTLLFTKDRSESEIKAALKAGRTAVWFNDLLVGKEENILPLLNASLETGKLQYNEQVARVQINNKTGVTFILENLSEYTFHSHSDVIEIHPGENLIDVKTIDFKDQFELRFRVLNAVTAPKTHPEIILKVEY